MKSYEAYKTPPCDWIEKIPSHWEARRIKTIFALRDERNYKPLSDVNLISLYTSVGVRQHKDIEHTTGNKARNADGYKIVYPNDIIVNILLCWMGAIGRSDYHGVTSPAYDIYKPKIPINTQYYDYLMRTPMFAQQCYRAGKGIMAMRWRTYSPQFSNIVVPIPPRTEQDQIVRFLDWKVSGINKMMVTYRREITMLNEVKQQIIDRAVIRGLHDQGQIHNDDIRWAITYPRHWKLQRIRESFAFRKGLSITKANLEESGVAVISYGQVHSKKNSGTALNDELIRYVNESYLHTNPSCIVKRGDFIFADTSEDVAGCGNVAYIDREDTIFAGYHTIIAHPLSKSDDKYFAYLFRSPTWRYQIRKKVNGVKVYSITQKILKDAFILIPPIEEQLEIVRYLDQRCEQIDTAISKFEEKITILQELKSRLIVDVVTGMIDVRSVAIPEYEFVEEEIDSDIEDEITEEDSEDQED